LILTFVSLMMAKQVPMGSHGLHWDPIGTATLCTLIDTNLCKPDDGQTRPKHVADVTSCRITTANCVV